MQISQTSIPHGAPALFGAHYEKDAIILGAGAAGITAALRLSQDGIQNVMILDEKGLGGNAASFKLPDGPPYYGTKVINGASVCSMPSQAQRQIFQQCGIKGSNIQWDMVRLRNPNTGDYEWININPNNKIQSGFGKKMTKEAFDIIKAFKRDLGIRKGVSVYPLDKAPIEGLNYLDKMDMQTYMGKLEKELNLSQGVLDFFRTNLRSDIGEHMGRISAYTGAEDQYTDQTKDRYLFDGGNFYIVNKMKDWLDKNSRFDFHFNSKVNEVTEAPDKVTISFTDEAGRSHTVSGKTLYLAIPPQKIPGVLGLGKNATYFPEHNKIMPDSTVDLLKDFHRASYAMISFFVEDRIFKKDNTFHKFPQAKWLADAVQYSAIPNKTLKGKRPSVITCYVPIPEDEKKDLPLKHGKLDEQALIRHVAKELAEAVPGFEIKTQVLAPAIKYYPEAMAAPKPGQVTLLRAIMNKLFGKYQKFWPVHSEFDPFPSIKSAQNRPLLLIESAQKAGLYP